MSSANPVSARADFLSALVWMAFALAVVIASWRMDRLESQGATFYTAPGLVPGLLGASLFLLGLLLAVRALRAVPTARSDAHQRAMPSWAISPAARTQMARAGGFLVLALAYAAGLVGRGTFPFWLATFLFVFLFIVLFDWGPRRARGEMGRGILLATVYGAGTSFLVSYVFQEIFLVRLP